MTRKRRRVIALATLIAATCVTIIWLEPFAPRFEGRTVAQWLTRFSAAGELDQRVVDHFHTAAIPRLIATIEHEQRKGRIRYFCEETLETVFRRELTLREWSDHTRMVAAGSWLSWLAAKGHSLQGYNFSRIGLWLDQYDDDFYGPRSVQLILTTPHESAAALARETTSHPATEPERP